MKRYQLWILIGGSTFVSLLYLVQIYLGHALSFEQQRLYESQQIAAAGPSYENAWKELATRIYQASRQDTALGAVLEHEKIAIHVNTPAAPNATAPAATKSPAPAATSAKTPATP